MKAKTILMVILCGLLLVSQCTTDHGITGSDIPAFSPATADGFCEFTTVPGPATFPSYMGDVDDLTYRIPTSDVVPPFPVIIIEPGFFSQATELDDIQNRYASHGFLVIGINNTSHFNLITTSIEPYASAILQTVQYAVEGGRDRANTLFGLIDTAAIGISGHSMGGGGTIRACDSTEFAYHRFIKCAIAMNPFCEVSGATIDMPVLLFSSDLDSVFNPFMWGVSSSTGAVYTIFQSIPEGTAKLFANFGAMDHNGVVDENIFLNTSGNAECFLPIMVSWFKVYLSGNAAYRTYLEPTGTGYAELQHRYVPKGDVPAYLFLE